MNVVNQVDMAKKADELARMKGGELVQVMTLSGPCVIFGAHLVHAKLIGIIGALMNLEEWADGKIPGPGVNAIVFRGDGMPCKADMKEVFATSHANTLTMAINLRKHFDIALNTVLTEEPTLSIRAALWHELLTSICHEIHHVAVLSLLKPEDGWSEEDAKAEEEAAKVWAKEKITELALTNLDMEPPPFNEEPFFGFLFMEANIERVKSDADENIWNTQLLMLTENWAWHDPSDGLTCHSWKDWINANVVEVSKESVPAEVTDRKVQEIAVKIINKDTNAESNVQTAGANAVIPVSDVVTKIESTFKYVSGPGGEAPGAEKSKIVEQLIDHAPNLTIDDLFTNPSTEVVAEMDPELLDLIENDMDDEPFISGHDVIAADSTEALHRAGAAHPDQPLFTSTQTTVEEQPVHTTVSKQPEMTQAFDPQAIQQTTQLLFQRLFQHLFAKCQPINGVFANPTAIFEPVPITDIPGINILVGCDTINETGQFKKNMPVQGFVKGLIFQKSKLPAYHIYLNVGGIIHQRRLIPQNTTTGSSAAQEAIAGNNIGWIIDAIETDRNAAFKFKYANGAITPC